MQQPLFEFLKQPSYRPVAQSRRQDGTLTDLTSCKLSLMALKAQPVPLSSSDIAFRVSFICATSGSLQEWHSSHEYKNPLCSCSRGRYHSRKCIERMPSQRMLWEGDCLMSTEMAGYMSFSLHKSHQEMQNGILKPLHSRGLYRDARVERRLVE